MIERQILDKIAHANNILLVSHVNPDGDTIGSAGAFAFYLQNIGKQVKIVCAGEPPKSLMFLNVKQFCLPEEHLTNNSHDLIITLDCADLLRTGIEEHITHKKKLFPIINIDHHGTNPNFGDINLVNPGASSTCEILYTLLKNNDIDITPDMATCLQTGILTDTTYFTNAATTITSLDASSELLNKGARIKPIVNNTWKNHTPTSLKIWGQILSNLHFNEEHKIAAAIISSEDTVNPAVLEGLANFLTVIYEANIIIVLRQEEDNLIKCSMRTAKEGIDVARVAQQFGGGGHKRAAGFSIDGTLIKNEQGWFIE